MTTIPQRLRDIARSVHEMEYGQPGALADSLRTIAAELEAPPAADAPEAPTAGRPVWAIWGRPMGVHVEAPAADAVPVVALLTDGCESGAIRADRAEGLHALVHSTAPLIRQRDHLATVSALQARIDELEARWNLCSACNAELGGSK